MVAQCISYSSAGLIKYHGQRQLKAERVCFGKKLHRKILLWKNPKKEKNKRKKISHNKTFESAKVILEKLLL